MIEALRRANQERERQLRTKLRTRAALERIEDSKPCPDCGKVHKRGIAGIFELINSAGDGNMPTMNDGGAPPKCH